MVLMERDKSSSCGKCLEPDTEEMVQCDTCDVWFHFQCVGVDATVNEMSWNCDICTATNKAKDMQISENNQSSLVSPQTQDNVAATTPFSSGTFSTTLTMASVASTLTSTMRNVSTTASGNRATNMPLINRGISNSYGQKHAYIEANTSAEASGNASYLPKPNNCFSKVPAQNTPDQVLYAQHRMNIELKLLEEENKLQQQYLRRKYEIINKGEYDNKTNGEANMFNCPTQMQILARQVLPKELPTFNGDPEDWPLFISCFENSTNVGGFSNAENLMRLQGSLKGRAREVVRSKLFLPAMVPEIIQTLKMYFGRPELIIEKMIEKARQMPAPKDKLEALIDFALCIKNICATMEACHASGHLNNPMLVKEFIDKLPNNYKLAWAMHPKGDQPVVMQFSNWIYNLAEAASSVVTPTFAKKNASVNIHEKTITTPTPCVVCKKTHKVSQCSMYANLSVEQKWDAVKKNNLCRICLNRHKRKCFVNKECGTDSCKLKHHPSLHRPVASEHQHQQNANEHEISNFHVNNDGNSTLFRIIPVKIISQNKCIETFAFLDEGSSATLIEESIFKSLDIRGELVPLCLRWTSDTVRREDNSQCASITIANSHNNTKYTLRNVHTVKNLQLPHQTVDMSKYGERYPYLKGLPIQSYRNVKPTILIGLDNWKLAVPLKCREGSSNQPIATKTRLGWAIQGRASGKSNSELINIHVCKCEKQYENLHNEVKKYFEIESSGNTIMSADDARALQIMNSTMKHIGGRFEVGLPWRDNNKQLNDSYSMAYKRSICLEKKFGKNPQLKQQMQQEVNNLLRKGYARKVTSEDLENASKAWYLPIFVTINPNKPNRVRLVWDAAAKADGRSLNDYLISGPDLLKPLVDILLGFRVGRVGICGDIAEMFHQIRVRLDDMQAQRFLWWNEGDDEPTVYVMSALTFGMNCAPFIAHYIRDKNAERFVERFPRAVIAITNCHYVDDFIDSVDTNEEARQLASEVKIIHAAGGFHIRKWVSNNIDVALQLNGQADTQQTPLELSPSEKVLGMYWNPNNDTFEYCCRYTRLKRDIMSTDVVPTKREVLQALMSIFDPLGFLSCHTIGLKILLQDIWRSRIDWDDNLNEQLFQKWLSWKKVAQQISSVKIPRCYSHWLTNAEIVQLHVFVDASEEAYAACAYIKVQQKQHTTVSLVAAKAKVAPLKPLSIPRLELQAAVAGIRLANQIRNNQRIQYTSCFWWSDSKTVLKWIRMDPKRLQQFVMHRVSEILESSTPANWRWVPSKLNPVDLATKIKLQVQADNFINGPAFLHSEPELWPSCDDLGPYDTTEIRHQFVNVYTIQKEEFKMYVENFSDWRKLRKAVSNVILFYEKVKKLIKPDDKHRSIFERTRQAELMLYREAQQSTYCQEISHLRHGRTIPKSSKLISLNVCLDEENVLKMRARTEMLINYEDVTILPKNHPITFLLVRFYHEKNHHLLHEASINALRAKFFIPQLRVLYKTVCKMCQHCKNAKASPVIQQMASLPRARLAAFERPFSYTGIDYFGPLLVTVGRRQEKRWGVIFTCLTLRAIHLEVACSLDTSSCMMCLHNFMARRGTPIKIYTDNGTNFRATEKILRDQLQNINYNKIASDNIEIEWIFNPPAAPHMGGAWERLIRSVKNVLYSIEPKHNWSDETLRSALLEVEFIINSRPLTFVSLDHNDDEALTPNHLLLGSSSGRKPICENPNDIRQRWQRSQEFANRFWQRWVNEYTPMLTRRSKWFEKQTSIQVGDIVIVVDDTLPRNCWPKGIVQQTIVAKDGQVRRAIVRTKQGIMHRPTTKLAKLDVGNTSVHASSELPCEGENVTAKTQV